MLITVDDPAAADVLALLQAHLAWCRAVTPPGHVHAFDPAALAGPAVTLVSARQDGALLGVAALVELDRTHAEVKSMHTGAAARGRGVGAALLAYLVGIARDRGYHRVSLETGAGHAFGPARRLYAAAGFKPCGPFGGYTEDPLSAYLSRDLS